MRDLIINQIREMSGDLHTQNAIFVLLGHAPTEDFEDSLLEDALNNASDWDVLSAYDLLCTPESEWEIMFGFGVGVFARHQSVDVVMH